MTREPRPHISELIETCEHCGERLESDICVTVDCPLYLAGYVSPSEVAADVARCGMYSPNRDTRLLLGEDESAVPLGTEECA